MEILVRAGGRSAHGSAPERGDNAVYKASRIALEIEKLNERLGDDPFLGKGSVAVTQFFFTSPSACAVPDSAAIQLDRRLTVGETKEIAIAQAKDAAGRAGHTEATVEVLHYDEAAYTGMRHEMEKYYPTWVLDESSPYLAMAVDAHAALFGEEPVVDRWTFSTNGVAIAGLHGIPCIGFGPGDEPQAHAPNECCPVNHLHRAAAFYAGLVARRNAEEAA
jgi:putative selenium metabolism hydrolase